MSEKVGSRQSLIEFPVSATEYFDFGHPLVETFAAQCVSKSNSHKQNAISAYYAVRDLIRYNPYTFGEGAPTLKASFCLKKNEGYCLPKSVLLGSIARSIGIPSRLGLADVRNHLASRKLVELLGTDLFTMHGYIELFLGGKWVKSTPAFNKELCEKFGVAPLEFDGERDSLFQPFDLRGQKSMEYVKDHGSFDDVPVEFIMSSLKRAYPHIFEKPFTESGQSLEEDLGE